VRALDVVLLFPGTGLPSLPASSSGIFHKNNLKIRKRPPDPPPASFSIPSRPLSILSEIDNEPSNSTFEAGRIAWAGSCSRAAPS
jgi:hypothetical protein